MRLRPDFLARAILTTLLTLGVAEAARAANPYRLDTAHAEEKGQLHCPMPRGGPHHVAVVYRDRYGAKEKYRLSVSGKEIGSFEANLTNAELIDGSRFWVWFTPAPFNFQPGDRLTLDYSTEEKGQSDVLELYFVKPDQLARLRAILAQESIVVAGKYLYTKLVSHYDQYTWQKLDSNESWLRVEAATGCEFVAGFRKGMAEGPVRSVFTDFVARVSEVRTWGYVEPAKGTLTKPIVSMKCQFDGPRLFDGKPFWIVTRGTTKHGVNQISPMFPLVRIDPDGAQKAEIDRCVQARKDRPDRDPHFGGAIDWEANPKVYVIAHVGMDHYSRHREGALKDRPEIEKERVLTAYLIRVSDGTPESNKHHWPLYYWNSWLHRSDGQTLDEELTRRIAAGADPRTWFFAVGDPEGLKSYLAPDDLAWLQKQGTWGPNSYLMYQIARTTEGRPRFVPYGHYLQPFPSRK